ncbi:hypothetical protein CTI12_AA080070 [Artemisia annua]|uniref:Uncharacterized protein n=1 Tax=Artemisia annua TaxID=35608 RepID=A0A2U1Q2W0_ARTAN|nr:hypothetical protein CTI12_AA080070 [Artemisia annua]
MMLTRCGAKRSRDEARNKPLQFIPGLTLSQHPPEQRKDLFLQKLEDIVIAKSLHPTEFEGYTIRERFAKMGWEQLLNFKCDKIYRRVVIQWTASLSRNGDELTGIVDGKPYTITPTIIRDLLKVDTRTDLPYERFKEADLQTTTDENKRRWIEACTTVFGTHADLKETPNGYERDKMIPLVQILWRIGLWTFHPRIEDIYFVKVREIYLLHALFTGDYLYSFAHLMIDDIWDMYEQEHRNYIPHGYYISLILNKLGAVSKDESVEMVPSMFRLISRDSFFPDLKFSESPTEYIIDVRVTQQTTFPKKVKVGEAPRQPPHQIPQPPFQKMPSQIHVPDPHVDMTKLENLIIKQSFQFQNQQNALIMMITNLQKQLEGQVLDVKCREEEIKKSLVSNLQMQLECQALDIERREQESEKRAEEREKLMVSFMQKLIEYQAFDAKQREQENEKRAEERGKMIVTSMQKLMESQALEAKHQEQESDKLAVEREKLMVTNIQKQIECQESEAKRREQESETRAENRERWIVSNLEKLMECQSLEAKRRKQESAKQLEDREKWSKEMEKSMVANIQKLIECQAFKAKQREEESETRAAEREKSMASNVQKLMECQATEAIRREQESEKRAGERENSIISNIQKQLECQALEAKRREQESEKWAEKMIVSKLQELMECQALEAKRREESDKWAKDRENSMVTTSMQKLMECQALEETRRKQESEKWAEEREKLLLSNLQKLMEFQALEANRCEQEREKRAEERESMMVTNMQKQIEGQALEAKRREKESEKRAEEIEIWAKEREMSMFSKMQKLIECQVLEETRQKQESENSMITNIQKQLECHESESKSREQESEKRAEEREKSMVTKIQKQIEHQALEAERREQEIERRAEIRAHAIIWDIERQRHLYEQEQNQLRRAWNQGNAVIGMDEFQFPQMSHTSFHPPRMGSRYYDPNQGDQIPQAFQSIYCDIYGQEVKSQQV